MELIFSLSQPGRAAHAQIPEGNVVTSGLPEHLLRDVPPALPELSELDVVRHYTRLSQQNFSIDTHFYPLGSCTMKYNPRVCNSLAMLPGFIDRHPLAPEDTGQGYLQSLHELQELLADVTGMAAVSLAPMAGSQGEFAGVAMIRAWHDSRGDHARREIIVPDAAHGTNPATAAMCGYTVREIPTDAGGNVDLEALRAAVGPQTAGLMLTNPSTLGVFEQKIVEIAAIMHEAGGLLYYDGANLNAILGRIKPGDMGFDVIHINLHKTFATPHGGGGPGSGPVGVSARLLPFLPVPHIVRHGNQYRLADEHDFPQTIGRLSGFHGNAGVLLRAYTYARMLGSAGFERVSQYATLNANYLMTRLQQAGFDLAYPERRASHEFIITLKRLKDETGITAMDFAKRLLDYGFHAPTTYFPLLVPECLLIEPTETESKATLDAFVDAMVAVAGEARTSPEMVKTAPHRLPVRRLDDVRAAREPNLAFRE